MKWKRAKERHAGMLLEFLKCHEEKSIAPISFLLSNKNYHGRYLAQGGALVQMENHEIINAVMMKPGFICMPVLPRKDEFKASIEDLNSIFLPLLQSVFSAAGPSSWIDMFCKSVSLQPQTCVDYDYMVLEPAVQHGPQEASAYTIKKACVKDVEELMPLQRDYELEEVLVKPELYDESGSRALLKRQVREEIIFIALDKGTIVAKSGTNAKSYTYYQIGGVYTKHENRRNGLQQILMKKLCQIAADNGRSLALFVKPENHAAIRLYKSLGFNKTGKYSIYYMNF